MVNIILLQNLVYTFVQSRAPLWQQIREKHRIRQAINHVIAVIAAVEAIPVSSSH